MVLANWVTFETFGNVVHISSTLQWASSFPFLIDRSLYLRVIGTGDSNRLKLVFYVSCVFQKSCFVLISATQDFLKE